MLSPVSFSQQHPITTTESFKCLTWSLVVGLLIELKSQVGASFCQRLVQEQLYTSASILASPKTAIDSGTYVELSSMTSMKTFVTSFAGHIAAEAART